jgi:hypothetical protein
MVTYFNKKDLIAFGKYLLSEERTKSVLSASSELTDTERLREVYHADVENFIECSKPKK